MYVESMGRTLLNLFKSYYSQLAKQDSIVVSKNDLIAVEEATLKSLFTQKVCFCFGFRLRENNICFTFLTFLSSCPVFGIGGHDKEK